MSWEQPRENSLTSHLHGITHLDGVDLDLRLTTDDELMLHHDDSFARGCYVENYSASELKEYSDTFSALLAKSEFTEPWQHEGKCVCIELKSPHPSSGKGGGWFAGTKRVKHLAKMLELVHEAVAQFELPSTSVVFYSFDPRFLKAAKMVDFPYPRARLMPYLREWGPSRLKKAVAAPSFIANSLPRLMRKHQSWGAPMIPCASQYLHGPSRRLVTGTTVGLEGKELERLTRTRKGFPAFVWPVPTTIESRLLGAGLTAITDSTSPEIIDLPCGGARWARPATQPLNHDNSAQLSDLSGTSANEKIAEFTKDVPRWHELDDSGRRELLDGWRKRWQWGRSLDELCADSAPNSIPWEVPRMVGHRGAGRTD